MYEGCSGVLLVYRNKEMRDQLREVRVRVATGREK